MSSYNNFNGVGVGLGLPGSGFASRGKGSHNIKRLSVAPPKISTINESQNDALPTPRTSRSHLLAGLRTAPKSATFPSTAPLAPNNGMGGYEASQWADQAPRNNGRQPQTSTGVSFSGQDQKQAYGMPSAQPMYSMPEQVLAPPQIEISSEDGDDMDQKLYDELVATNLYLAEQQQRLQQQLISVTAAAQQFQGMNLYGNNQQAQQYQQGYNQMNVNMNMYQQQLQQALQPIVQAVPNQPGLYSVFNPLTGQQSFVVDPAVQSSSPPPAYQETGEYPIEQQYQQEISPPASRNYSPVNRGRSPPKSVSPVIQEEVTPLPPPSANAFRRGHKKGLSSLNVQANTTESALKSGLRTSVNPQTPVTGTFGPGQARAGEHPTRQPRGPPSIEELKEKPTFKHEGSKNFASRHRRRALNNLVQAGIGRRNGSGSHPGSTGSQTPASERELNFSSNSDDDIRSSGRLSHKNSFGSVSSAASRAIGSERKQRSHKGSHESLYNAATTSSDDAFGGKSADVKADEAQPAPERRNFARLALANAEKRRSFVM